MLSVFYYVSSQALHPSSYKSIKTPIRKITFTLHILNICNKSIFAVFKQKTKNRTCFRKIFWRFYFCFPIKTGTDNISLLLRHFQIVLLYRFYYLCLEKSKGFFKVFFFIKRSFFVKGFNEKEPGTKITLDFCPRLKIL